MTQCRVMWDHPRDEDAADLVKGDLADGTFKDRGMFAMSVAHA
jgi:hypothetical protein